MKELTPAQRRALRAQAHALHPVASIAGKGLSPAVLAEIDRCLKAHELVKVRVYGEERDARDTYLAELCTALDAAAVQHIGNILVLYRPRPEQPAQPASAATPAAKPAAPRRTTAARAPQAPKRIRTLKPLLTAPKPAASRRTPVKPDSAQGDDFEPVLTRRRLAAKTSKR